MFTLEVYCCSRSYGSWIDEKINRGSTRGAAKPAASQAQKKPNTRSKSAQSQILSYKKQKYTFTTSVGAWNIINQRLPNPDRVLQNADNPCKSIANSFLTRT